MKPQIDLTKVHATINVTKELRAAKQRRRDECQGDKNRLNTAINDLMNLNGIVSFNTKDHWQIESMIGRWPNPEHTKAFKYCQEKLKEIENYVDTEPSEASTAN